MRLQSETSAFMQVWRILDAAFLVKYGDGRTEMLLNTDRLQCGSALLRADTRQRVMSLIVSRIRSLDFISRDDSGISVPSLAPIAQRAD
jgi:hypothetical protein